MGSDTANTKTVDESLWWDPFSLLLSELENAPLRPSSHLPSSLVNKLKKNHGWFLDSVSLFKRPSQSSKSALDSSEIAIGSHRLPVKPELKEVALEVSSCLCLDEAQSYILVTRLIGFNHLDADYRVQKFLHLILLRYSLERQCLLKCLRQILMHALYIGSGSHEKDAIREVALQLINDGLEAKLLSVLQSLLSSKHPERMEVDLVILWAEETLIEVNLVLDILFLVYYDYEIFCTCKCEQWKSLCSIFRGVLSNSSSIERLAISTEAAKSLYFAKVQLLLILIETLDLDNLLRMIHDEVPFRQDHCTFSLVDVQEMDVIVSSFNAMETAEAGPLILAWAVFLCLISSLPEKQDCNPLIEIDHVAYVRQAFEATPLNYILEIFYRGLLTDSDSPIAGYRSVLRTFISAFIASYEVTHQLEGNTFAQILDILFKIYHGEESLCIQFWDKDSFVDGPIRCLLSSLESEFPFRMVELFRLLSALCEGSWPAECVYNFLDKMVGITTLFEIPGDSCVEISQIIETLHPVPVPGVEGLLIPSGTCGHVLRVIDGNIALIRWENMQSGVFVLLLHLAREFHVNRYDDVLVILDLLCRMVSFNTALSFALMDNDNSLPVKAARMGGQMEKNLSVDAVRIICFLLGNLEPIVSSAGVMSMCISILTKLMKCSPSCVSAVALKTNMFGFGSNGSSSCMWLLSGGLARMLLYDCEQNEECCSLTISVLNFTMQLVETGVEDNMVSALVVFSLQYVLVNHENWKYKLKHVRWKVTLKVLEVMKKCIKLIQNSQKLGCLVRDIVLGDCSIHDTLCRIMCITTETLERMYVSRLYDLKEIEGLQLAVCSVIEIVLVMLADLSKDFDSGLPAFHQVMLSSVTKPIPVVTAMISWISFFRNPEIQVAAARVVSLLCITAGKAQTYSYGDVCIVSDDLQVRALTSSISEILSEEIRRNDDLFVAVLTLLTSAAQYQPAFLLSVMSVKEDVEASTRDNLGASFGPLRSKKSLMESILQYVKKSEDLIESHPYLLLSVLKFLKALWQGAAQYMQILETVKNSEKFWKYLLSSVSTPSCKEASLLENIEVDETLQVAFRYQCQSAVLDIMAHEVFLQKKMLRDKISEKKIFESSDGKIGNTVSIKRGNSNSLGELQDLLSAWLGGSVVENLVKLYASCGYDRETISCAKMAASLFTVHALERLLVGDAGSLSLSLVEKISKISQKLTEQPAFSELKAQYSLRGYSEGKDLSTFIFSDLYYHLQGEMEGREIPPSPFKELSLNLLQSEVLQTNKHENMEFCPPESEVYLFDLIQLCTDLGLSLWDHSDWKASKPIAERMLVCMRNANVMSFLADSKHSSLRSLMAIITVCEGNLSETKPEPFSGVVIEPLLESCINHLCKYLQKTSELFVSALHASDDVLYHLTARADLLLNLVRFLYKKHSLRNSKQQCLQVCTLVLKTSGSLLGVLSDIRPSNVQLTRTVKLFLTLLLTAIEFSYPKSHVQKSDSDAIDMFTEVSLVCLGLLPVLCGFVENAEYGNLSVAAIDMMLKGFLTYSTWLPILQTHLQLQHVQWKLQQKDTRVSVHVILKFLLTLARTRGGAEMLQSINLFASLKVLFALLLDNKPFSNDCGEGDKEEKPQNIWGVGLAIITAMICSLGDDPSCTDLVDSAIPFFFSEKSYLIFCYLSAPDFPTDDHSKKRARTQTTQTCLTALTQTEQTLTLICMLAKHIHSWSRSMKEMDSQLRERSIHLLAFISKGTHRLGESLHRTAPLLCTPILKEEVELNGRPAFVESKHGWFTLSALGCGAKTSVSSVSTMALSLPGKDQTSGRADLICRTYFTDIVAIQIYRIAFLLLKFLCLQAKAAAWRAEEVGFINLAHFPELPMPEILHGLQDQAIAIVTELCEANSSKTIHANTRDLCLLLLQIMEMALYLELCVSQTCEIRPVLGRVEDFSKEIKALIRATEKHTFFKASLKSVKQIITLLYPSLLQTEGIV